MSSTHGKQWRNDSDYYVTPQVVIDRFLNAMLRVDPAFLEGRILDPCAGGAVGIRMPYPEALMGRGVDRANIDTIDIREDSPAAIHADFLGWRPTERYSLVITNPPFLYALPIIQRALDFTDKVRSNAVAA